MAKCTDAEDFVVLSRVRTGLKREFEFALKAQSEICGSLGRTRSRKSQNGPAWSPGKRSNKKLKKESKVEEECSDLEKSVRVAEESIDLISEEEAKSDVVDVEEPNREVDCCEEEESRRAKLEKEEEIKNGVIEVMVEDEVDKEGKEKCEPQKTLIGTQDGKEEEVSKMDVGIGEKENELESATTNVEEEKGKEDLVINSELCKMDSRKPVFDSLKGNSKIGEVVKEEKPLRTYTRSKPRVEKVKEAVLDVVVDANDAKTGSDDNRVEGVDGPIMPEINVATKSLRNFPAKAVLRDAVAVDASDVKSGVDGDRVEGVDSPITPKIIVATKSVRSFPADAVLGDAVVVDASDVKSGVDGDRVEGVDSPITPEIIVATKSVRNSPAEAVLGDAVVVDASDVKSGVDGDRVEGVDSPITPEIIVATKSVRNSPAKAALGDAVVVDASDVKSGVDGDRVEGVDSPITPEIIVATKSVRNFPTKLKDLFDSGMLEGANVRYARSSKVTKGSESSGLQGVIKGAGILCFCNACNGVNVITSTLYENHAGSTNKRPAEYIYLDNGHTLRDVMNACKDNSLTTLEKALQLVIGSSMKKSSFCLNCRESITAADSGKSMILCNSCVAIKESQDSSTELADASNRSPKPTVVPKSQISASKCSSSQTKSQGRVTRKDLRMHKLVFEEDGLPDGTELRYFVRGQKMLVGYKRGFGILCTCCNSEVSPSQFEAHAGWATRRKPFQHIYTSNGVSLHELSISLLKNSKFPTIENDNLCSICLDGGNLFCCNTCPRAFHTECVSLPSIPTGTWHCRYCQNAFQKEKFVERNANALAAGRVAGIDPIEQITKRCIRIIKTPETEVLSVCVLCRGHTFSKSGFGPRTVILCDQCEREYHVGCLRDHNMDDLKELPKGNWFCCTDCNRIHSALQKLIVRGEEKLPDSSLLVVKNKHEKNSLESKASLDIRWRVLSGKMISSDDTRVLLSKAVAIFHERFDPISDSGSSKGDLIPSMVYGRTVKGQDFGGMYCAILTVNQVVVSAGIFRIFGQEVAEIPLVATSTEGAGQGYFQCLFSCLEKLLGFLNVKNLVLPAAEEAESIWTKKFGFDKMTKEAIEEYKRDYQMMVFQGTSMLQKPVPGIRLVRKSEHE
ncbi:hypothetical protein HRI_003389800 [Hibiscus trionum]|uniref:PHD-type domain-containing protein n=1 Tax=Hibiscus trionum TaxID=183268 RepID=A0A9W7MGI4_HIBTR|nr:hypothetical protein HRI_003389800 [Hibiscus trionum]